MHCPQQISYVIRQGDNLYQLANFYQTTVPLILSANPNIDPYNLQIGSSINICPGEGFGYPPQIETPPADPDFAEHFSLNNDMRLVWEQHVYWTRMLIISIVERLKDEEAVTKRLMQNPNDIAAIYARYYSADVSQKIAQLLTEHLQIGGALITALRDGKSLEADRLNHNWYKNADDIAAALSGINPYYDYDEVRDMMYRHLKLTTQEVSMRLSHKYREDIDAFNAVEQEALSMSDYFTSGLTRQFPQHFNY